MGCVEQRDSDCSVLTGRHIGSGTWFAGSLALCTNNTRSGGGGEAVGSAWDSIGIDSVNRNTCSDE